MKSDWDNVLVLHLEHVLFLLPTIKDKLISISLPRVKDFRGVPRRGFDGNGNYNFGLDEQLVFPEIKYDNVVKTHGMNITIVTTTSNDKKSFKLLELLGLPFARGK